MIPSELETIENASGKLTPHTDLVRRVRDVYNGKVDEMNHALQLRFDSLAFNLEAPTEELLPYQSSVRDVIRKCRNQPLFDKKLVRFLFHLRGTEEVKIPLAVMPYTSRVWMFVRTKTQKDNTCLYYCKRECQNCKFRATVTWTDYGVVYKVNCGHDLSVDHFGKNTLLGNDDHSRREMFPPYTTVPISRDHVFTCADYLTIWDGGRVATAVSQLVLMQEKAPVSVPSQDPQRVVYHGKDRTYVFSRAQCPHSVHVATTSRFWTISLGEKLLTDPARVLASIGSSISVESHLNEEQVAGKILSQFISDRHPHLLDLFHLPQGVLDRFHDKCTKPSITVFRTRLIWLQDALWEYEQECWNREFGQLACADQTWVETLRGVESTEEFFRMCINGPVTAPVPGLCAHLYHLVAKDKLTMTLTQFAAVAPLYLRRFKQFIASATSGFCVMNCGRGDPACVGKVEISRLDRGVEFRVIAGHTCGEVEVDNVRKRPPTEQISAPQLKRPCVSGLDDLIRIPDLVTRFVCLDMLHVGIYNKDIGVCLLQPEEIFSGIAVGRTDLFSQDVVVWPVCSAKQYVVLVIVGLNGAREPPSCRIYVLASDASSPVSDTLKKRVRDMLWEAWSRQRGKRLTSADAENGSGDHHIDLNSHFAPQHEHCFSHLPFEQVPCECAINFCDLVFRKPELFLVGTLSTKSLLSHSRFLDRGKVAEQLATWKAEAEMFYAGALGVAAESSGANVWTTKRPLEKDSMVELG